MAPTVQEAATRVYYVALRGRDGPPIRIVAETLCKGSPVTFKRDGETVAEIHSPIAALWIVEEPSDIDR